MLAVQHNTSPTKDENKVYMRTCTCILQTCTRPEVHNVFQAQLLIVDEREDEIIVKQKCVLTGEPHFAHVQAKYPATLRKQSELRKRVKGH